MKAQEMKAGIRTAAETPAAELSPTQWKTYRTRFLVKAKQLSSNLVFTDSLGRRHSGRKGDYLVESTDGVLSIAPRQIFEDIYVSMPFTTAPTAAAAWPQDGANPSPAEPARVRRKLPQPCSGSISLRGARGQGSGVSNPGSLYATGFCGSRLWGSDSGHGS
jgi:hypothetical protein